MKKTASILFGAITIAFVTLPAIAGTKTTTTTTKCEVSTDKVGCSKETTTTTTEKD